MLEYKNIKIFLQKVKYQIGLKKFFLLKTLEKLCRGYLLLVILTVKKLLELLTKKNYKKQVKKWLELKK